MNPYANHVPHPRLFGSFFAEFLVCLQTWVNPVRSTLFVQTEEPPGRKACYVAPGAHQSRSRYQKTAPPRSGAELSPRPRSVLALFAFARGAVHSQHENKREWMDNHQRRGAGKNEWPTYLVRESFRQALILLLVLSRRTPRVINPRGRRSSLFPPPPAQVIN